MNEKSLNEIKSMSNDELKAATRILKIQCGAMLFVGDRSNRQCVLSALISESNSRGI